MDTFLNNIPWMAFNVFLACLGAIFGLTFLKIGNKFLKMAFFVLWLLFLPNTIYLLTDLQHLPGQTFSQVNFTGRFLVFLQYVTLFVFGVFTFVYGLFPIEKLFHLAGKKDHKLKLVLLVLLNFMIAFGVGMGRIERTHSWYVFTQPYRVVEDILSILTTSSSLVFIVLFGVLCNLLYFSFHKAVQKTLKIGSKRR